MTMPIIYSFRLYCEVLYVTIWSKNRMSNIRSAIAKEWARMKKLCTTLHSVFYSTFQFNYYFGLAPKVFLQFGSMYIVATILISCSPSSSGKGPLPTPADNVAPTAVIKPDLGQAIYRGDSINFSASNSYDIDSNGAGFNNVTPLFKGSTRLTAVDFLLDQLKNNRDLSNYPTRQNIKDSNATPLWPLSDFIQPVNGVP